MGGCVASKLEDEEEVVSICRERKTQLKLAVERRYALAEAHCKYNQSLFAVAAAIKLFVARHSSPSSPFLITFPEPSSPPIGIADNVINNPMFLQQTPTESTQKAIACDHSDSSSSTSSDSYEQERAGKCLDMGIEMEKEEEEQVCGYYYMQMQVRAHRMPAHQMESPQRDLGWDFFNPFDGVRPEVINNGYSRYSEEELKAVREQEGIPELEEEGEREEQEEDKVVVAVEENGNNNSVGGGGVVKERGMEAVAAAVDGVNTTVLQGEQKGLTVMDTPEMGRELLEALKDIEDYFIKAHESGKDVSRMLEANKVHMHSGLEEIRENSTKLLQIAWHRSASSRPSSCKSLVTSSSKSSSSWTEFRNDLFDDFGGMDSGSHSLTLGRLYAWEKKLYEEVKAGDCTRKVYEKKCSQLRNHDTRGDDILVTDKTRAAVKDLYARILVAIRSAESISRKIQKLTDEELQPQIVELLQGLTKNWKVMLESHETQKRIMMEVKFFTSPSYGKFCNNSHRLATLQLEAELYNWRACFSEYVIAQRSYIEALYAWLSKFTVPEVEFCSRGRSRNSFPEYRVDGPPLLVICHDWLASLGKLPDKSVAFSMKGFARNIRALWVQQGEEQQQKRKVDSLAKELEKRVHKLDTTESRLVLSEVPAYSPDSDVHLTEKNNQLDICTRRLDVEKERHHNSMQETHRITLNGLQAGFSSVFESLVEFSKASLAMYSDLVSYSESIEKAGNSSCLERSKTEDIDGSR